MPRVNIPRNTVLPVVDLEIDQTRIDILRINSLRVDIPITLLKVDCHKEVIIPILIVTILWIDHMDTNLEVLNQHRTWTNRAHQSQTLNIIVIDCHLDTMDMEGRSTGIDIDHHLSDTSPCYITLIWQSWSIQRPSILALPRIPFDTGLLSTGRPVLISHLDCRHWQPTSEYIRVRVCNDIECGFFHYLTTSSDYIRPI